MKRVLLTVALCVAASASFAQKKVVNEAQSIAKGSNADFGEARTLIKGALENPETKDDAKTWYVAGFIEDQQFNTERAKQILGQQPNEPVMYEALYGILPYFQKAYELDQLPNEKGKVKPKYTKDIKSILSANHVYLFNGGAYYFDKQEYKKAYDFFNQYVEISELPMFAGTQTAEKDSTFMTVQFYAAAAASLAKDSRLAIAALERAKNTPYRQYDVYQYLCYEYGEATDLAKQIIANSGYNEISLMSLSSADYSCLPELVDQLLDEFKGQKVSVSLPSLRVDSFSVDIAKKVQQVRKSGLTFAPEAGTQRLRDVINKGVTEEDLLAACENAFENGWSTVKLYFMMGLPTETDEDLAGIADLAYKVLNLYRKVTHKNNGKVTVSVSSFVPKSHTAFQWFGQLPIEEIERKQQYIKGLINDKHISYHYHDAKTGRLEATFARGDRRMGKVLYEAWKLGCKFDGWTEMFDYDMWMKAFDLAGIDPDYYAARTRSLDEALPWDHLSNGAAKAYLKREWQKASRAELTHDCRRLPCTGCGVCPNLGVSIIDRKEGDDHGKTTFSC